MYELKHKVEKVIVEEVVISGKLFVLFKEWIKIKKLSNQKLRILSLLDIKNFMCLDSIHLTLNISLPLLSYHINGNLYNKGLISLDMIEKKDIGSGEVGIRLTKFGKLIISLLEGDE